MEIKVQDLRIGNLVLNHDTIDVVSIWHLQVLNSESDNYFMPIPLSEEILLKCGFTKYEWFEGAFIKFNNVHLMIRFYKGQIISYQTKVSKDSSGHKMVSIGLPKIDSERLNSLHKLQNYYYSNTGQELNTSGLI